MTTPSLPSREEVESLCIVYAAGRDWRSLQDLAEHLGLSPDLGSVMDLAVEPLVAAGRLQQQEGLIRATDEGWDWLQGRLAALVPKE